MGTQLTIGAIYHHRKFEFKNGDIDRKFIVLLNEPITNGENYLFVKTTTKEKGKRRAPGCQTDISAFFIVGSKEFFSEDTWVQLHEIYEFEPRSVLRDSLDDNLEFKGILSVTTIAQLKNCIKILKDVSGRHKRWVVDSYERKFASK